MASNFRDFNGDPGDHLHGKTTITINLWFLYYLLNNITEFVGIYCGDLSI